SQQQGGVEIARRRGPAAPASAAAGQLLASPDERATVRAAGREALRFLVGAVDLVVGEETVEGGQPRRCHQLGNSEAAAAWAASSTGPANTRNSSTSRPEPAMMAFMDQPGERSKAAVGSSKYITLTMRR